MIDVKISSLVKKFGDTVALNHIDLHINPSELFFLLGPSGCGKTTLLRSLAGFYIPDEGSIHFGDREVTREQPHKRNTGMMFQSYALWPHKTVAQNVAFGLEQQNKTKDEIDQAVKQALDSVQMGSYADRKPNALSGGQQQRVALARALVIRPSCLLLDEPLSNLDAKLRLEMRTEIRRICKEFKLTTIYVTHDQKEALSIADRMAVLKDGDLLQVGSPLETYKRPRNSFVANFIGETNFLEGTVEHIEAGMAQVTTEYGVFTGVTVPGEEPETGKKAYLSLRPECLKIQEFKGEENSLEGRIEDAIYYGEVAHYVFTCMGKQLKISELNPRHLTFGADKALYATIETDDLVVLKE